MTIQQIACANFGMSNSAASINNQTQALNAAANYYAVSFIAKAATSLSAIRHYMSTKNGTGGTITCALYGDSGGVPNIAGGALDTLTVGALAANSYFSATGGTYSLTEGTRYWVVFYNTDATPASNNITMYYLLNGSTPLYSSDGVAFSTNTGSTWTARPTSQGSCRFSFADGTYYGVPAIVGIPAGTVYSAREIGTQFTTPSNAKLNVAGISMLLVQTTGSPTGDVFFNLYDSTHTLLAKTDTIANALAKSSTWHGWQYGIFTNAYGIQTLSAGTTYTVTIAETTQSDTSSNVFGTTAYSWDSDSNSTPLIPWSMQADYYNGTSWAQTANNFSPFQLLLATGDEFTSTGGAAGIANQSRIIQNIGTY